MASRHAKILEDPTICRALPQDDHIDFRERFMLAHPDMIMVEWQSLVWDKSVGKYPCPRPLAFEVPPYSLYSGAWGCKRPSSNVETVLLWEGPLSHHFQKILFQSESKTGII